MITCGMGSAHTGQSSDGLMASAGMGGSSLTGSRAFPDHAFAQACKTSSKFVVMCSSREIVLSESGEQIRNRFIIVMIENTRQWAHKQS